MKNLIFGMVVSLLCGALMGEGNDASAGGRGGGGHRGGGHSLHSRSRPAARSRRPSRAMRSKAKPRKAAKAKGKKVRKKPSKVAKSKRRAKGKRRLSVKRHPIKKNPKHPKRKAPGTHAPGGSGGGGDNGGGNDGDNCLFIVRGGCCRCGVAMGCDADADALDANDNGGADNDNAAQEAVKQTRRYLQVKNDTAKTLTVYLQYHTLDEDGWDWFPAEPSPPAQVAVFKVPAGQVVHLIHDDFRVNANRVRIWTATETQYKDTDLWLVPEEDEQGNHWYLADEMETSTVTFCDKAAK